MASTSEEINIKLQLTPKNEPSSSLPGSSCGTFVSFSSVSATEGASSDGKLIHRGAMSVQKKRSRRGCCRALLCCAAGGFDDPMPPLPSFNSSAQPESSVSVRSVDSRFSLDRFKLIRSSKEPTFQMISANKKFTLDEIFKFTGNFSKKSQIGEGSSSVVYMGELTDGTLVAIKRAKKNMVDVHTTQESFRNEIQTLQQIDHQNLVRYYGYMEYDDEQIIVVEYVPNGNLRQHLDGVFGKVLDFRARLTIAIDVAHAITYLHTYCEKPIIHRDIKSSNILLTNNLNAKVTDFGFSRFGPSEQGATHVHTRVKGTIGYLDLEYFMTGLLTNKSDVFSFGVLLVEMMTGRHPVEPRKGKEKITAEWAIAEFVAGRAIKTLDPNLEPNVAINLALEQVYELASQCLAQTRQMRPKMKTCAQILWGIRKSYHDLLKSEKVLQNESLSPKDSLGRISEDGDSLV